MLRLSSPSGCKSDDKGKSAEIQDGKGEDPVRIDPAGGGDEDASKNQQAPCEDSAFDLLSAEEGPRQDKRRLIVVLKVPSGRLREIVGSSY
jgi:hypothetical protein